MNSLQSRCLCVAVSLLVAICDQWTKHTVAMFGPQPVIASRPFLSLSYSENTGGAWSAFHGHPYPLAAVGVVTMAAILLCRKYFSTSAQKILMAIIFGGILGNTIDRIFRGYVIDFIALDLQFYRWPTFNLADCVICVGTLVFLFTF
ncbi:MAG: signal peptidase II [Puniceicoccales bacterium]|jgi:signal peptidase II|nr:signal peptidase II [Puniceicoccales bacterium]